MADDFQITEDEYQLVMKYREIREKMAYHEKYDKVVQLGTISRQWDAIDQKKFFRTRIGCHIAVECDSAGQPRP